MARADFAEVPDGWLIRLAHRVGRFAIDYQVRLDLRAEIGEQDYELVIAMPFLLRLVDGTVFGVKAVIDSQPA